MAGEIQKAGSLGGLQAFFDKYNSAIASALPKHMTPERVVRIAISSISRTPQLLQADIRTIGAAVIQASILGLEPNSELGHAYLVPFKNNKRRYPDGTTGVLECQLIPGYKGIVKLARNSGEVGFVDGASIRENDHFVYDGGLNPMLEHKHFPKSKEQRGKVIGYWAGYKFKNGETGGVRVVAKADADAHRDKFSKACRDRNGSLTQFWTDEDSWMYVKFPLKQALKLAPTSAEVQRLLALDDTAEYGRSQASSRGAIVDLPSEFMIEDGEEFDDPSPTDPVAMPKRIGELIVDPVDPAKAEAAMQPINGDQRAALFSAASGDETVIAEVARAAGYHNIGDIKQRDYSSILAKVLDAAKLKAKSTGRK